MSVTTNLGLTLIDEGIKVDNDLLNTNFNLIDAACGGSNSKIRNTNSASVEFTQSQMNSGTAYTGTLFDINDYDLCVLNFHALGSSSYYTTDKLGWLKWSPGTDVSNYNLFSIYGSKWTTDSGSTVSNAWSVQRQVLLKLSDGVWTPLLTLFGPDPNAMGALNTNWYLQLPASTINTINWPVGNTNICMSGQGVNDNILSSSTVRCYLLGYQL